MIIFNEQEMIMAPSYTIVLAVEFDLVIYHYICIEGQNESKFRCFLGVGSKLGAKNDQLLAHVWLHI